MDSEAAESVEWWKHCQLKEYFVLLFRLYLITKPEINFGNTLDRWHFKLYIWEVTSSIHKHLVEKPALIVDLYTEYRS